MEIGIDLHTNIKFFILSIFLSIIFVIGLYFGIDLKYFVLLALLSLVALFTVNYEIVQSLLILSIFIYFEVFYIQISVWITLVLLISFLITYVPKEKGEFVNNLLIPLTLVVLSMFISLVNSHKPIASLYHMLNFFALIIVCFTTAEKIKEYPDIKKIIYFYLSVLFVSSTYIFVLELITKSRVFGFTEVMFVDFAGVGILFALIMFIFEDSFKKWIFAFLSGMISLSLILTQTRNAWISVVLSVLILGIYLFINSEALKINHRKIIIYSLVIFVFFGLFFLASNYLNPKVEERVISAANNKIVADNPASLTGKSLITRVLIWHTAIMAFLKHPVIGIGAYSFPFSSQYYYKMPKVFYEMFVKGLNPHQGYLGMLTETGIIGLLAFLFFIKSAISLSLKTLRLAKEKVEIILSLSIFIALVYVSISFVFTQEWIYGQMAVFFGLILGMLIANYNLLVQKYGKPL